MSTRITLWFDASNKLEKLAIGPEHQHVARQDGGRATPRGILFVLLRYKLWSLRTSGKGEYKIAGGALIASVYHGLSKLKSANWARDLFGQNGLASLERLFAGESFTREKKRHYRIRVSRQELPPDALTINIDDNRVDEPAQLSLLLDAIGGEDGHRAEDDAAVPADTMPPYSWHPRFHDSLDQLFEQKGRFKRAVYLGYGATTFWQSLKALHKTHYRINSLRVLLRDVYQVDPNLRGAIPRFASHEEWFRRHERPDVMERTLCEQIAEIYKINTLEIRYFASLPCLRLFLADDTWSILTVYEKHYAKPVTEFNARHTRTVLARRDSDAWGPFINQLAAWYEFIWEHGSYPLSIARAQRVKLNAKSKQNKR